MNMRQAIQYLRARAASFDNEEIFIFKHGELQYHAVGDQLAVGFPAWLEVDGADLFHNHGAPHSWQDSPLSARDIHTALVYPIRSIHAVTPRHIYSFFPAWAKQQTDVLGLARDLIALQESAPTLEQATHSDLAQLKYSCAFPNIPGALDIWITDPIEYTSKLADIA